MSIYFHQLVKVNLQNRKSLKAFIPILFTKEKKLFKSLSYIFCSDEYLLEVNNKFLQHNFYTDIITFDLSASKSSPTIGEIYISVDRVKENAITHQSSFETELHRVIFHGALHLCGYKDKTKKDSLFMRDKEDDYLSMYFE
ncbi:MAG: rRNA maturation RNase YbeY [Ferruginibacter sp.]|nr:rRNA maturation RNase YbeY [Ferruginibacter sp.]